VLLWCAVYASDPTLPDAYCTEEEAPRSEVVKRFDAAAKLGRHDHRRVNGMWLIDEATEEKDVIKTYGQIPDEVQERHKAYLAKLNRNQLKN